jgi:hypothetical protein
MGVTSSVLGLTQFTEAEVRLHDSFSSESPWSFDDPRFIDLLSLKHRLDDLSSESLTAALGGFCDRLVTNASTSRNLATLAAQVASRLSKSSYFVSSNIISVVGLNKSI